MTVRFALEGFHRPVLEIAPEYGNEAILLAAFLRYDANTFSVSVERYENGQIKTVTLRASEAQ